MKGVSPPAHLPARPQAQSHTEPARPPPWKRAVHTGPEPRVAGGGQRLRLRCLVRSPDGRQHSGPRRWGLAPGPRRLYQQPALVWFLRDPLSAPAGPVSSLGPGTPPPAEARRARVQPSPEPWGVGRGSPASAASLPLSGTKSPIPAVEDLCPRPVTRWPGAAGTSRHRVQRWPFAHTRSP